MTTRWKILIPIVIGCLLTVIGFFALEKNDDHNLLSYRITDQEIEDYQTKGKRAYDRPDLAFKHNFEMTKNVELGRPTPEVIPGILKQLGPVPINASRSANTENERWRNLGPNNVGGRTRAICVDLNDASDNTVWAGAVTGGLWKTTNFLSDQCTWQQVQALPTGLSVNAIKQNPTNPSEIYLTTGEESIVGSPFSVNSSNSFGMGVWKSSDGGNSWDILGALPATLASADVDIDQAGRVYVAFEDGLLLSDDGGQTFSNVFDQFPQLSVTSRVVLDIEITADSRVVLGCGRQRDFRQSGIIIFNPSNNQVNSIPIPESSRIEIALAPTDANRMYALVQKENVQEILGIIRSDDGGQNWLQVAVPVDVNSYIEGSSVDFTRGQTWYNLIGKVHPNNPDCLVIGGIDLFRSLDGGRTWGTDWCKVRTETINTLDIPSCPISLWYADQTSEIYVHADNHALEFLNNNPDALVVGNDGGIQFTSNILQTDPSFTEKNNGYLVTQYYACGVHPDQDLFVAGAQDNGTHQFNGLSISDERGINGGDGGYCFVLEDGSRIVSYIGNTYDLLDPSDNKTVIYNDQNDGLFINPADYDAGNRILYSIHRVRDGLNSHWGYYPFPVDNGQYRGLGVDIDAGRYSWPTSITSSPLNTPGQSNIFLGTNGEGDNPSYVLKVENANTSQRRTTEIGSFLGGWISSIAVGETEKDLIVTFSNYGGQNVWVTRDGGSSWRNIDANLPDIPVRSAVFSPYDSDRCLIGTELGIWKCNDLTAESIVWEEKNEVIGRVRVDMLRIRPADNLVVAASHGRGMWVSNIFESDNNTVTLQPNTILLPDMAGDTTLTVTSNVAWSLAESSSWFELDATSGDSSATITLTYERNESLLERRDVITVSGEGITSYEVPVIQQGNTTPTLQLLTEDIIIPAEGGSARTSILANVPWQIATDSLPDWLSEPFPSSGGSQLSTRIGFEAEANESLFNRYYDIKISSEAGEFILTVSQPKDSSGYVNVTPNEFMEVSALGERLVLSVASDLVWDVSSTRDWLQLSMDQGRDNGTLEVIVASNVEAFPRSGSISISSMDYDGDEIVREIEISQLPGEDTSMMATFVLTPTIAQNERLTLQVFADQEIKIINATVVHISSGRVQPLLLPYGSYIGMDKLDIDIGSDLPKGVYVLKLDTDQGVRALKFVNQ